MSRILFAFIALFLFSCSGEDKEQTAIARANDRETEEVINDLPKNVHNTVSLKRHFSSQVKQDEFVLLLQGESYPEAELTFCILNDAGDTLFARYTTGKMLLEGPDELKNPTEAQQMEKIQQRMSTFFAETSFSNPPFTINDPTKDDFFGDVELWNQIKDDSTAWCFEFALCKYGGYEVLAYSREKDTIIVYDGTP